jgi:hypothetical protein
VNSPIPTDALRGLHLPAEPGWWPPAPGWWILAVLVLLLLIFVGWQWRVRRNTGRWRVAALAEFDAVLSMPMETSSQCAEKIQRCSVLLRRTALALQPRIETAGTTGEDWLRQLDALSRSNAFTEGPGRAICEMPYQRPDELPANFSELMSLVEKTIRTARGSR